MTAIDMLRDALYGNPPSATFKPNRAAVLAAFSELQYQLAAMELGISSYATIGNLPVVTSANNGQMARVYADSTSTNNTFWIVKSGVWGIDVDFGKVLSTSFQPVVDLITTSQQLTEDYLKAAISIMSAFSGQFATQGRIFWVAGPNRTPLLTTIRDGTAIRFKATGASSYSLRYVVHPETSVGFEPYFDIYINGAASGNNVILSGTPNIISSVVLASGLNASLTYNFELRLRSTYSLDNRWNSGAGPQLVDVTGGTVTPWVDTRNGALFIGDSITAGLHARSNGGTPVSHGGDICYGRIFCELAGLKPIINGFGGIAVVTNNASGDIPRYWNGSIDNSPAFFHKSNLIVERENLKHIFVNLGQNDNAVDGPTFKASFKLFCLALKNVYPNATIHLIRPFSGTHKREVLETALEIDAIYEDTFGWDIAYTDGLHPTVAGHSAIGNKLFATQSPTIFTNGDFTNGDLSMWLPATQGGFAPSLTITSGQGHLTGMSRHVQRFSTKKGYPYTLSFSRGGVDPHVQKSDDPDTEVNVVTWTPGANSVTSLFIATSNYTYVVLSTFTSGWFDNISITEGNLTFVGLVNGDFTNSNLSMWQGFTGSGATPSLTITSGQGHLTGFSQHSQGFLTTIGRTYRLQAARGGSDPYLQKADDAGGGSNPITWNPGTSSVDATFVATSNITFIVLTTFTDGWYDNIVVTEL
jgi:hypothetical protein